MLCFTVETAVVGREGRTFQYEIKEKVEVSIDKSRESRGFNRKVKRK